MIPALTRRANQTLDGSTMNDSGDQSSILGEPRSLTPEIALRRRGMARRSLADRVALAGLALDV